MLFRRSGSVVAYFVDGRLPAADSEEFAAQLAKHRFRTIETAANEDSSIGWVTAGDPTGDSFEYEDLELDPGVWLRVRIDKKKLPSAWLQIHRASAERSAGRPLSVRERRELKADLCERLLPRTLPSVQFVDALWLPKQKRVTLFATSKSVREEFEKLFFKTFAAPLEPATPYTLATHSGLDRDRLAYLEEVAPVRWPSEPGGTVRERRDEHRHEPAAAESVEEDAIVVEESAE